MPEGAQQVRAFAALDRVLRELADVQVEGDEVADVAHLAGCELALDFLVAFAPGDDLSPGFGGQGAGSRRRFVPALAQFQRLQRPFPDTLVQRRRIQANGNVVRQRFARAVAHGRIDVTVGVGLEQIPDRGTLGVLERDFALGARGIEQERQHGVLADVLGDVFLGVVRPHLLLVDVFLEDVSQHVRIDLVVFA